jgi:hypothetical protein
VGNGDGICYLGSGGRGPRVAGNRNHIFQYLFIGELTIYHAALSCYLLLIRPSTEVVLKENGLKPDFAARLATCCVHPGTEFFVYTAWNSFIHSGGKDHGVEQIYYRFKPTVFLKSRLSASQGTMAVIPSSWASGRHFFNRSG